MSTFFLINNGLILQFGHGSYQQNIDITYPTTYLEHNAGTIVKDISLSYCTSVMNTSLIIFNKGLRKIYWFSLGY